MPFRFIEAFVDGFNSASILVKRRSHSLNAREVEISLAFVPLSLFSAGACGDKRSMSKDVL